MLKKMNLTTDSVFEVAHYIYTADPGIFDFIFGNTLRALTAISKLVRLDDNAFSHKHIYLYFDKGILLGCISMFHTTDIDSQREWHDLSSVLNSFGKIRVIGAYMILHRIVDIKYLDGIYIQTVAINATHRGDGHGSRMVQLALDTIRSRSNDAVYLDASLEKPHVKHFYEKLGFQGIGTRMALLGPDGVTRMKFQ
ncbi:GNAT family N-acetyltransferase [Erysipelothrix anatis]|uniref:GNAT family N-acetyltransferase n=1 Tax=Erysipelothrix anatis TaxID=2683713 RepID=UPI0013569CA5|nr:GNAT family N-acetyltransferase [Erysipelothrix anatis]